MGRCFVIQPFDRGVFDKRYREVFAPAIKDADLEPYRVDEDPGVSIPIETIEREIRDSEICLAEITTDNPNVWFELGFAIAAAKEVVLVCAKGDRKGKFPFDIQHRNILEYPTESPSDFDELRRKITKRLKALVEKQSKIKAIASISPLRDTEGLSSVEVVALAVVMQNRFTPDSWVAPHQVSQDMQKAGYTKIAISLAIESLVRKGMIEFHTSQDINGIEYSSYRITAQGIEWLLDNQEKLVMREPEPQSGFQVSDDEIPF